MFYWRNPKIFTLTSESLKSEDSFCSGFFPWPFLKFKCPKGIYYVILWRKKTCCKNVGQFGGILPNDIIKYNYDTCISKKVVGGGEFSTQHPNTLCKLGRESLHLIHLLLSWLDMKLLKRWSKLISACREVWAGQTNLSVTTFILLTAQSWRDILLNNNHIIPLDLGKYIIWHRYKVFFQMTVSF